MQIYCVQYETLTLWCTLQLTQCLDFTFFAFIGKFKSARIIKVFIEMAAGGSVTKPRLLCFIFQLRNAMVNRRTGTFSMEVKKTVDRGVRLQIKMFSVSLSDEGCSCSCLLTKGANLICTPFAPLLETCPEDAQ